ncbi:hypothetical protein SAMN05216266_13420 [Amycolatopsis marina]|uniref:Uncharacterized protein n=5 Tax=Pseudonocardiaceae TaxID=2070 RepID=A0A1I1CMN0_9PSEU|nr:MULTISPECIES: hypothetical protein [Pseudonocardiaceae]EHR61550.1 hypothetical protein SaccyDRAFT_2701 [Saccharomonospora cyanea NA-134]MBE1579592.1 hypothetical protein [Amycolatopsis roodepoortensis]MBP2371316.1 hypothetical protein [Pseudonocardia parietis]TQM06045.1 hypothetical protein FB558_6279 [Pseudonocardia kunmingensis]TWE15044.1 hypothetical protein FHX69_7223 [Prauserella muralis]
MTRPHALDGIPRKRVAAMTGESPAVPHAWLPLFSTVARSATCRVVLAQEGSHS